MSLLPPPHGARLSSIKTRWSLVPRLEEESDAARKARWQAFLEVYRVPMVAYADGLLKRAPAAARRLYGAEDLVQAFLVACVEKGWLEAVRPGTTRRFRALLQTMLKRWVAREVDYAVAEKRRPSQGADTVSLDELLGAGHAVAGADEMERAFDRDWARQMVARTLTRLRASNPGYADAIELLMRAEAVASREPSVPGVTPVMKLRAKPAFYAAFIDVLIETVGRPEDLPDEWLHLAPHLP